MLPMTIEPSSVCIAAASPLPLEKLLGEQENYMLLGSESSGEKALKETLFFQPDVLILRDPLPGRDGLSILDDLKGLTVCPPRVLYLNGAGDDAFCRLAREKGADDAISVPVSKEALLSHLGQTAALPVPRLARGMEETRLQIADDLLALLRVRERLKGRSYMRFAVSALCCSPRLSKSYSGLLYPYLAREFHSTPQAVERALRTAVEDTWLRGSLKAIQALFGLTVDAEKGKPTNAEFLSMLSDHARRLAQRKLEEEVFEGGKQSVNISSP